MSMHRTLNNIMQNYSEFTGQAKKASTGLQKNCQHGLSGTATGLECQKE
uniref:Uncharacterized protein n=1 Tax=Arundo donax TaxID=35708 RepID=A0A0A9TVQ0_ARUDO